MVRDQSLQIMVTRQNTATNIYHTLNLFGFPFNNTENQATLWKHKDNVFFIGSHRNSTGNIYPVQQSWILFSVVLLVCLKNVLGFTLSISLVVSLYSKWGTKFAGLVPCQKSCMISSHINHFLVNQRHHDFDYVRMLCFNFDSLASCLPERKIIILMMMMMILLLLSLSSSSTTIIIITTTTTTTTSLLFKG